MDITFTQIREYTARVNVNGEPTKLLAVMGRRGWYQIMVDDGGDRGLRISGQNAFPDKSSAKARIAAILDHDIYVTDRQAYLGNSPCLLGVCTCWQDAVSLGYARRVYEAPKARAGGASRLYYA